MARRDPSDLAAEANLLDKLRQALLAGLAITLPIAVTILVLAFAVDFLTGLFDPVVATVERSLSLDPETRTIVLYALTSIILLLAILIVGIVATTRTGSRIEATFDEAIARIPAIGSVYTSFDQMSEMLLDNDAESFQEVVLVEYPTDGSYAIGFVTADPRAAIAEATGHDDATTVFVPMAPNPVMGGFVLQVSRERLYEVDMTVEEGIQAIVTSGVALADEVTEDAPKPIDIGDSLPFDLPDSDDGDGDGTGP